MYFMTSVLNENNIVDLIRIEREIDGIKYTLCYELFKNLKKHGWHLYGERHGELAITSNNPEQYDVPQGIKDIINEVNIYIIEVVKTTDTEQHESFYYDWSEII